MKKIIAILSLVAMLMVTLTSCGAVKSQNPERPTNIPGVNTSEYNLDSDSYRQVAENGDLVLLYNDLTTDIKVKVKSTGYEWSTEYVPVDGYSPERGQIFTLAYSNNAGTLKTMTSVEESIKKGQFRVTDIENGIKVEYGVGYVDFKIKYPRAISQKRADEIKTRMTPEDQALFDANYMLIDFDSDAFRNAVNKEENEQKFPLALQEPWYYPRSSFNDNQVIQMNELFARAGYTDEELARDNKGVVLTDTERPEFAINIYYTLENGSLSVRIPETEIYHSKNFVIKNITLHENFMTFDPGTKGYYLLPDGSGSVMNFDNKKDDLRNEPVYIPIYGIDESRTVISKTANFNDAVFPILGACVQSTPLPQPEPEYDEEGNEIPVEAPVETTPQVKNGVLAIIEEGETFSGVEAHPGNGISTNKAWIEFRINEESRMRSFSKSGKSNEQYAIYQYQRYLGDLKVRYKFLTGEDSEYAGMAKYYRSYLFGDVNNSETKPYYSTVEMIGVINGYGNFMGISYNTKETLTDFNQVETIAKDLQNNGMKNFNIKLTGWFNGGYEHGYADKIKVMKQLGGTDGLKTLISNLNSANIGLYPDVDIQHVYREEESKISNADTAYMLNRQKGAIYSYSAVTFAQTADFSKHILSMNAITRNFTGFFENYKEYELKNISLRSMGDNINANYNDRKDFLERQDTMKSLLKLVDGATKDGYKIMGTGGNAPFVKYMSVINNMPIQSAGLDKCDYSVPFTAMVLSGNVDYTYKPINLSNSDRNDLLKLIEAGSGAYFTLTGQGYEKISETPSKIFYSTVYSEIEDSVMESYNYVSGALKDTYGQQIVNHERLVDGVFKTTYKNGHYTIVNYNDKDYTANGITVKAKDYYAGNVA